MGCWTDAGYKMAMVIGEADGGKGEERKQGGVRLDFDDDDEIRSKLNIWDDFDGAWSDADSCAATTGQASGEDGWHV